MATDIIIGKTYISFIIIRYPVWPKYEFLNKYIIPAMFGAAKTKKDFVLDSVGFIDPDTLAKDDAEGKISVPPDFKSGRGKPWAVIVQWRKISDTIRVSPTEAGLEGWIKYLVKFGLPLVALGLGYLTFRVITKEADKLEKLGKNTVFNPGFVVAAMVIVFLLVRR